MMMLLLYCSYPETRGLAIEDAPKVFRKHWFWKRYALLGFETENVSLLHPKIFNDMRRCCQKCHTSNNFRKCWLSMAQTNCCQTCLPCYGIEAVDGGDMCLAAIDHKHSLHGLILCLWKIFHGLVTRPHYFASEVSLFLSSRFDSEHVCSQQTLREERQISHLRY